MTTPAVSDVCLIVEGAYPYIAGGVSSWTHDLIQAHADLTFDLLTIVPDDEPRQLRFDLPKNVVGLTEIVLQQPDKRIPGRRAAEHLISQIQDPLRRLLQQGSLDDLKQVISVLHSHPWSSTRAIVMNSEAAFEGIKESYTAYLPGSSFLNYFWSWRSLVGSLLSVLLAKLPQAKIYHAISTGYAGLAMARAVVETGRPGLLTEHGIYTNERRVELAMADWLADELPATMDLSNRPLDLRNMWMDAFTSYSRVCYNACTRITTLYSGNQTLQLRDRAPPDRLAIIPNGIDYDRFSKIHPDPKAPRPAVGLIGRVVPIKDIKTYIRAAGVLRELVPQVRVMVLGPTDEDAEYFRECADLVSHLGLAETLEFTGRVKLDDYLGRLDVIALTSLSEAQPLVLLEAGAAGIPSVATDVGSCRDLLLGRPDEDPALGPGGIITPLANPLAIASGLADLLLNSTLREQYGNIMRERTRKYYNKQVVDEMYRAMYDEFLIQSTAEMA